jgi:tyrosyl-tRNA synthetase
MSISDELMARYYPLLQGRSLDTGVHPLEAKKRLAFEIVKTYHSRPVAQNTLEEWNVRFGEKRFTDAELPTFSITGREEKDVVSLVWSAYREVLRIKKSRSEIWRLVEQGSVQVDGKKIADPKAKLSLQRGQVLRLDKTHAVRIG